MSQLSRLTSIDVLRRMTPSELRALSEEIREFLVDAVSKTGGHLGPNLGVVELSIALHRVFDSPKDRLVFDTGHQSYVHKILTGRTDFSALRKRGGISGYPARSESIHDIVENSHASTALSWAEGIARANRIKGLTDRSVVAVIGDGALTGGMSWEALNTIADEDDTRLIVVINDNGRSYEPTIGGLAHHLDALRTARGYEKFLDWGKRTLKKGGTPGNMAYDALHGLKKGVKDVIAPQGFFENLGIKYIGPVDGHDPIAVEFALTRAKAFGGPVLVHVITEKGRGYRHAENHVADRFHAVGVIHPETGLPVAPSRFGWTSVFAEEMVKVARKRADVVGITAAMLHPVGLAPMREEFPDRVFDVGIAEQHAVTSAAGLAFGGMHPVFAVYATFLNRAYDQLLLDVALHKAPVTFMLDRAGITGDDGASHNGMWDLALMRTVPGIRVAVPRDGDELVAQFHEALDEDGGPTLVRYPKGSLPEALPAQRSIGEGYDRVDVLSEAQGEEGARRVLVVGLGPFAPTAVAVGKTLAGRGEHVTVVDPRWVLPHSPTLIDLASAADLVVHIEDGLVDGGIGDSLRDELARRGSATQVACFGIPKDFHTTASRAQLIEDFGLTPEAIVASVGTDA
ncbi:1-deoxy-D-xylulose-5-phosphate synthase [Bowdeniella nasicola]|uniref:1-deoxy-D-xylulose-5-phosphate synthase n=1 Tax=Bowdeniella nasicola TaxID=208480 RepID=A0A1Q5Q4Z3_9ACTO|nr:1-deoxy-D-xylulose-5-phosphate synthase [Bowdeniella nasicola]OKL54895.1 1-deoxy-D-xylulose-5-phosphate synthase [Bowdeniella nasicola]